MRCDDIRKSLGEGSPLDEAIRDHLGACAACGDEFAALRALIGSHPAAPPGLRARVFAELPARRANRWRSLSRAAAVLLVGLGAGFAGGWTVKAPAVVEKERIVERAVPFQVVDQVPVPMEMSNDDTAVLGIALERVYGEMVKVVYGPGVTVERIEADRNIEKACQVCPVARGLFRLAGERPQLVRFR
jgi:hypothetical protein